MFGLVIKVRNAWIQFLISDYIEEFLFMHPPVPFLGLCNTSVDKHLVRFTMSQSRNDQYC